ncbi:MAG: hemolysin family protein [Parvibaculales bacterium]
MSANGQNGGFWSALKRRLLPGQEANLRESLEDVLEESDGGQDDFSDEERHMLKNLLGFRDVTLDDVMVPRAEIDGLEIDSDAPTLLSRFSDCGHSRMPVYRETLDQPLGMLHVKDLLSVLQAKGALDKLDPSSLIRPLLFVPPSMSAMDLLLKMQTTRSHMALVIDEYGGTDGLVTIEDLIEEIVGEIEDEHDAEEVLLRALENKGAGHWRASARLPLEVLQETLKLDFSKVEELDDIDTLGGLVFALAGRVPERGELIDCQLDDGKAVEFIIRDGDPRRVKSLDIRLIGSP